ncbi:MAG: hypothetical protein U0457_09855 [Candidatus Sericytochromatia bacterium]
MIKKNIILTLNKDFKEYLGEISFYDEIEVAEDNNLIWVKIPELTEELDLIIKKIPLEHKYYFDEKNRLFEFDKITPIEVLKKLNWESIYDFLDISFSLTDTKIEKIEPNYKVELIVSSAYQKGSALLVDLKDLKNYVETSSNIRFKHLIFASNNIQSIVIGEPLPAIKGKEYCLKNNLLIPSGYSFELELLYPLIAKKLNAKNNAYILFYEDNTYEKILIENFIPVSRSAIRLSMQ